MNLIVNEEPVKYEGAPFVESLVEELGAKKAHTALMLNAKIIPVEKWATTALMEGDQIEMLVFVGGG
jgi:thiamine biosynthesis protein ThiS